MFAIRLLISSVPCNHRWGFWLLSHQCLTCEHCLAVNIVRILMWGKPKVQLWGGRIGWVWSFTLTWIMNVEWGVVIWMYVFGRLQPLPENGLFQSVIETFFSVLYWAKLNISSLSSSSFELPDSSSAHDSMLTSPAKEALSHNTSRGQILIEIFKSFCRRTSIGASLKGQMVVDNNNVQNNR